MDRYTVSLFGHRTIDDLRKIDKILIPIIEELMRKLPHVIFLIGRNGEFDEYSASIIKSLQKKLGKEKGELVLVLPYGSPDLVYFKQYYDDVMIPDCLYGVHPKSSITLRNRWIVERSDLVIAFAERAYGGAYQAMKYAQKLSKNWINLSDLDPTGNRDCFFNESLF